MFEGAVALVASPVAIIALVNLAKQFGVTGKWSTLLAVVLGLAIGGYFGIHAGFDIATALSGGFILGMTASGLWDVTTNAAGKSEQRVTNISEQK